uniref:Uncharacterized protein n=1 Tax=Lepeophtheirus salmonis TaxID=72036 RepID=A0A0K2UR53_LEPSM
MLNMSHDVILLLEGTSFSEQALAASTYFIN